MTTDEGGSAFGERLRHTRILCRQQRRHHLQGTPFGHLSDTDPHQGGRRYTAVRPDHACLGSATGLGAREPLRW